MMDKMLNALLMMFVANAMWGWLGGVTAVEGLPFNPLNLIIAIGVWMLLNDIADYGRAPSPKAVIFGGIVSPFWIFARRLIK